MKIFVDGHFLDGSKHGVATYLDRLYSHYARLNDIDEIHFGMEPNSPLCYELFSLPRVYIHRYRIGGWLRFIFDIPRIVHSIDADVVHTQYVMPLTFGSRAIRHVTLHDILYEDFGEFFSKSYRYIRRICFGWSARKADILTTVSKYSRARIAQAYGRPEEQIYLVPPGIEAPRTVEKLCGGAMPQSFLLYVSRFEKRKNHSSLIETLPLLRKVHKDLKLILVGFDVDGTLSVVRKLIADLDLDDVVEIHTNISGEKLRAFYRSAAAVVYPSFGEGFGMPIIEAFFHNPNTLFSDRTAMAELPIANGRTFNPEDVHDMIEKIDSTLNGGLVQGKAWELQRDGLLDLYNWCSSARSLIALYHGPHN